MLTTDEFFKHQSPFLATVRSYGVAYPPNPGVWKRTEPKALATMNPSMARLPWTVDRAQAKAALARGPAWVLLQEQLGDCSGLLNAADLRTALNEDDGAAGSNIDRRKLPAERHHHRTGNRPLPRPVPVCRTERTNEQWHGL